MKKIASIEELKEKAVYDENGGTAEFFIFLNGGFRSSKRITYFPNTNTFDIYNEIDDSFEEGLSEDRLKNETHIVIAIENGAFYMYD